MKIRNLIFDMGNVLFRVDPKRSEDAFNALRGGEGKEGGDGSSFWSEPDIFELLELGNISVGEFFDSLRKRLGSDAGDAELADAWNAMIIDAARENLEYLSELKQRFRIFLLSNTNEIHMRAVQNMYPGYTSLFERMFLSHELGLRKPDKAIFETALRDARLIPQECLFIDDLRENVAGAKAAGLNAVHLEELDRMKDILSDLLPTD